MLYTVQQWGTNTGCSTPVVVERCTLSYGKLYILTECSVKKVVVLLQSKNTDLYFYSQKYYKDENCMM